MKLISFLLMCISVILMYWAFDCYPTKNVIKHASDGYLAYIQCHMIHHHNSVFYCKLACTTAEILSCYFIPTYGFKLKISLSL